SRFHPYAMISYHQMNLFAQLTLEQARLSNRGHIGAGLDHITIRHTAIHPLVRLNLDANGRVIGAHPLALRKFASSVVIERFTNKGRIALVNFHQTLISCMGIMKRSEWNELGQAQRRYRTAPQ